MEQEEQEKRSYILEHENMMQHHTMKLFENLNIVKEFPNKQLLFLLQFQEDIN